MSFFDCFSLLITYANFWRNSFQYRRKGTDFRKVSPPIPTRSFLRFSSMVYLRFPVIRSCLLPPCQLRHPATKPCTFRPRNHLLQLHKGISHCQNRSSVPAVVRAWARGVGAVVLHTFSLQCHTLPRHCQSDGLRRAHRDLCLCEGADYVFGYHGRQGKGWRYGVDGDSVSYQGGP